MTTRRTILRGVAAAVALLPFTDSADAPPHECPVCGQRDAYTAEEFDRRGFSKALACFTADEGELYLHECE